MSKLSYWQESLESSLDANGAWNLLSKEQITLIAKDLVMSHEMYSEYSGEMNIPHPLNEELRKSEERYQRDLKDGEKREDLWKTAFANKLGVEKRRLHINHGDIELSRT